MKQNDASEVARLLTQEAVTITQKALKLFEQSLRRIDCQSPQIAFAEETMNRVKSKLDAMSRPISHMRLTTFDYNERLVLAAAMELYMLDLHVFPATSQRARELHQCQQIVAYFAPPIPMEERKRGGTCAIIDH